MEDIAKKVLAVAAKEIGVTEYPANSNRCLYNDWFYGKKVEGGKYPWCQVFVTWCFNTAGHPLPYKTASCSAMVNWYTKNHPECVVAKPQPGFLVYFNFGHVGIVEKDNGNGTITTIEGNTSAGDTGSQSNGGGVFRKIRKTSIVSAYINPFGYMDNKQIKEDDDMDVTRFKELYNEMRAEWKDNDAGTYSKDARDWAVSSGLIQGNGTTVNGEPNYLWGDTVSREALVTVLYRFAKLMGKA